MKPQRFRKKPVVIEAMRLSLGASFIQLQEFCPTLRREGSATAVIPTLEGDMLVSLGDWIIKGVAGKFYPCKPGIFKETYEDAE